MDQTQEGDRYNLRSQFTIYVSCQDLRLLYNLFASESCNPARDYCRPMRQHLIIAPAATTLCQCIPWVLYVRHILLAPRVVSDGTVTHEVLYETAVQNFDVWGAGAVVDRPLR